MGKKKTESASISKAQVRVVLDEILDTPSDRAAIITAVELAKSQLARYVGKSSKHSLAELNKIAIKAKLIDGKTLGLLEACRKLRNAFAHDLVPPSIGHPSIQRQIDFMAEHTLSPEQRKLFSAQDQARYACLGIAFGLNWAVTTKAKRLRIEDVTAQMSALVERSFVATNDGDLVVTNDGDPITTRGPLEDGFVPS